MIYLCITCKCVRCLYFGPKTIFTPPPPPLAETIFCPLSQHVYFRHLTLTLVLPSLAFILLFYFPFSLFLFAFFLYLSPFFVVLLNFLPFSLPVFIFFPQIMSDIFLWPPGEGDVFSNL